MREFRNHAESIVRLAQISQKNQQNPDIPPKSENPANPLSRTTPDHTVVVLGLNAGPQGGPGSHSGLASRTQKCGIRSF